MSGVVKEAAEAAGGRGALDHGTYEVLRGRLAEHAGELGRRAEALNARRLEVFGGAEMRLAGTERIRTAHKCVPRDVVALGDVMLFGYNVFRKHIGRSTWRRPSSPRRRPTTCGRPPPTAASSDSSGTRRPTATTRGTSGASTTTTRPASWRRCCASEFPRSAPTRNGATP
ncbi:DNA repair ATPase [Actinomadura monticuli]|uniref:DNA repair ATPase n=1 Tax=Actinomadura monticuli TaxID=3097367 RepID=UPI00356A142E